jgi:hypothetical protein
VRKLIAPWLPGLFVWHWIEGHYLLRRREPSHADHTDSTDVNLESSPGDRRRIIGVSHGVVNLAGGR